MMRRGNDMSRMMMHAAMPHGRIGALRREHRHRDGEAKARQKGATGLDHLVAPP